MKVEDLTSLSPRENRRARAVLGLGAGDSLGVTYEFKGPKEVPREPLEIVGGGIFGWRRGEPTDDTELALAVREGYRTGELNLTCVRDAMLRWRETDGLKPWCIGTSCWTCSSLPLGSRRQTEDVPYLQAMRLPGESSGIRITRTTRIF